MNDEVLTPELKIAIVSLIKEQSNQQLSEEVRNQVASELALHDAKYSKFSKAAIENKMAQFSEEHLNQRLADMVEKVIGECKTSVNLTKQMVDELRQGSFPVSYVARINTIDMRLSELEAQFGAFRSKFETFISKRVIDQISNDDMVELYRKSGSNILEVASYFNVTHAVAHDYVSGKTPNIEIRNRLHAFLAEKAKKKHI